MSLKRRCVVITVGMMITLLFHATLRAGILDDFEEASTQKPSSSSGRSHDSHDESDDNDSVFFDILFEIFHGIFVYGGKSSLAHINGSDDPLYEHISIRETGAPNLPFIRGDVHYQWVDSDVYALDGRLEAGVGPMALQLRSTRFKESSPDDSLTITYVHGLFRMSGSRLFEWDLGLGSMSMEGNERHSGFSMTFPLSSYPFEHFGLRLVPTLSGINGNVIKDMDVSMALVYPFAAVQLGYRNIEANGVTLNGPYAGLSFYF